MTGSRNKRRIAEQKAEKSEHGKKSGKASGIRKTYQVMADLEWIRGLLSRIDEAMDVLQAEAEETGDAFWEEVLRESSQKERGEKNQVGVRVRRRVTGITIEWFWNKWYRTKDGRWRPYSQYIRKGPGDLYPESRLKAKAAEWEWPLVWETEEKMAEIRKKAKRLSGVRKNVVRLQKSLQENMELFDGGI